MENINIILKQIRIFNRLTQLESSKILNISRSYISEIESGKKIPSTDILQKYSQVFDLPISSLIFFTENIEDKKLLKNKAKFFIQKKTIDLLNWICK